MSNVNKIIASSIFNNISSPTLNNKSVDSDIFSSILENRTGSLVSTSNSCPCNNGISQLELLTTLTLIS